METELKAFFQEDHGLVFWAALAFLAIGVSVLVAVGLIQLRRIVPKFGFLGLPGRIRQKEPLSLRPPGHRSRTSQSPQSTHSGPRTGSRTENGRHPHQEVLNGSLPILLRRLQSAADRLEKMADDLSGTSGNDSESSLKPLPGEVEYVFKASRR